MTRLTATALGLRWAAVAWQRRTWPAWQARVAAAFADWRDRLAPVAYASDAEVIGAADALATADTITITLPPWRSAPVVGDDWRCPYCTQWRCRAGREGRDCRVDRIDEAVAYSAARALPLEGRHDNRVLAFVWSCYDQAQPVVWRRELARRLGLARPPLMLAAPVGRLP
jgi:hypothetical protein